MGPIEWKPKTYTGASRSSLRLRRRRLRLGHRVDLGVLSNPLMNELIREKAKLKRQDHPQHAGVGFFGVVGRLALEVVGIFDESFQVP